MTRCSKIQLISTFAMFVLSTFLIVLPAYAQGIPTSGGINLTLSTNNPAPGQDITITARSFSMEIDSAKIAWSVDGSIKQNTIGGTKFTVKAPALGKETNINVTATSPTGGSVSSSIIITSGSVDMIVETDGYVPPLFAGKVAPVYQNSVKIVAIPHIADSSGKELDPKNLVYKWKRNSQVVEEFSGYGKQSVVIKGDLVPRPYSMSVTASTRDGSVEVVGTVSVTPQNPTVSFYVNDPLYGTLFNKAIADSVSIGSQKETGVLAAPYGFNKYQNRDNLSYIWLINNVSHPELSKNQSVILRAPSDAGGTSNIQLNIKNKTDILQTVRAGFSASFGAKNETNQTDPINF